jgi:hypothetical protein
MTPDSFPWSMPPICHAAVRAILSARGQVDVGALGSGRRRETAIPGEACAHRRPIGLVALTRRTLTASAVLCTHRPADVSRRSMKCPGRSHELPAKGAAIAGALSIDA